MALNKYWIFNFAISIFEQINLIWISNWFDFLFHFTLVNITLNIDIAICWFYLIYLYYTLVKANINGSIQQRMKTLYLVITQNMCFGAFICSWIGGSNGQRKYLMIFLRWVISRGLIKLLFIMIYLISTKI